MLKSAFIVAALSAVAALPALGGISPHETISATIGGNTVKITYGRPFSKKPGTDTVRKIWGDLVPWDKPYRLGADQATTLVLQKGIVLGALTVPAGTYTLYMVPSETGVSKLAVSKKTGQWGIPVQVDSDLGRVDLKKTALDNQLDQLTLSVAAEGQGGVIKIQWEKTQYSVNFTNAP